VDRRLTNLRVGVVLLAALLAACSSAPPPAVPQGHAEGSTDSWYQPAVAELKGLNQQARGAIAAGKQDDASAIIQKSQPLTTRLLAVTHPTLEAMEAASDSDQLYADMLLKNSHQGWARMLYQKNVARWKNWRPQTEETARRRKLAESGIAECDRQLTERR